MMASVAASPRACDVDHLLQSLAGNRMATQKLAQMFLDMYPGKIALIDAALQDGDWVALRRVVHDLRGSCAMFSATACLALAGKLEDTLPDHVDQELPEYCARFRTALADVAAELQLFLDERPESCQ
jgi:HPt (histidine-containing phosphotransfer) domain-containing protein